MAEPALALYRGCKPVVDAEFRPEGDESPTTAIVEALATAAGTGLTELQPLYEAIDTDALDRLFAGCPGDDDTEAVLSFTVDTWNVFVRADGHIRVCDATEPTDPTPVFQGEPA
jgi:hypothetical protein